MVRFTCIAFATFGGAIVTSMANI